MADNVGYTPGSGALIKTDQGSSSGAHMVITKLAESTDGGENLVPASATYGLSVDVTRVQGAVSVTGGVNVSDGGGSVTVDDGGSSLTVDGSVTANQGTPGPTSSPWPVRLSDGTVTASMAMVAGSGALRVAVVDQSGASTMADGANFTEGSSSITVVGGFYSDSPEISLTEDSASALRLTSARGLHANLRTAGGAEFGTASAPIRVDPTGTTTQPVSGTVTANLPSSTNAGAAAKIINYHTGSGTDNVTVFGLALPSGTGAVIGGTASAPIRVDPTGSTTQPVSGTVTANQGAANATPWNQNLSHVGGASVATAAAGVQKVGVSDASGAAFTQSNPMPSASAPHAYAWMQARTFGASETAVALKAPSGGKTLVLTSIVIVMASAGIFKLFDGTDSDSTTIFRGALPAGVHVINFASPVKLSAANNVLRYSTGAGAGGDITVHGYEI